MPVMEIAVVGDEDFVLGFRLAGVRNIFPITQDKMEETIYEVMKNERIGIVVVRAEEVSHLPQGLKLKMMESIRPVFITIGGEEGELRERVRRAIGVDLYKSD